MKCNKRQCFKLKKNAEQTRVQFQFDRLLQAGKMSDKTFSELTLIG